MQKQIVVRLFDCVILGALVFGNADARTFAAWLIAIMVGFIGLAAMAITEEVAKKIHGRGIMYRAFLTMVNIAYVASLIYAGYPILAALYAIVMIIVRLAAIHKIQPQVAQ